MLSKGSGFGGSLRKVVVLGDFEYLGRIPMVGMPNFNFMVR